jgi:hypothetical protein
MSLVTVEPRSGRKTVVFTPIIASTGINPMVSLTAFSIKIEEEPVWLIRVFRG